MDYSPSMNTVMKKRKWKCELCDKLFTTQDYLDQHLLSKHLEDIPLVKFTMNLVNEVHVYNFRIATVCLADYCDSLQCEAQEAESTLGCKEEAMLKRKFFL